MAATGSEIANAFVSITVKAPGVQKDIEKQLGGGDYSKVGRGIGDKVAAGIKKTLKVGMAGVAAVATTALVKGFGRLKAIENAQAKMRGLGHDSDTVATAMDNALKAVQGTAYGLGEAATVASGAMAAQIKPGKELEAHLTRVSNNAAAAGVSYEEMGAIFNKAATQANGVQNDLIGQLADKGIPIYEELGKVMGVTGGEVFKLASEGKVSFEMFSQAAEAAAGTVADEMGKTTTGSFDNMLAALGRLGAKVLEDLYPLIGPFFQDVTAWLDEAGQHVEPLVDAVGTKLKAAFEGVKTVWGWLKDNSDWIVPTVVAIGAYVAISKTAKLVTAAWKGSIAAVKAVQTAYTAYTYGMAGATYTYEGASKSGAIATKLFNAALKANPIGVIITAVAALVAGLVWFFTQTETGRKIWEKFTTFIGEAWANISQFFQIAWTDYIKPVFDGIASIVTWVWENVIQPVFNFIAVAAAILGGVIAALYDIFVKPAIEAIGAIFQWVWAKILKPVIDLVVVYIKMWAAVITWLWNNAVKPALDAIGKAMKWVWDTTLKPVITAIWDALKVLGGWFSWLYENVVKPVWDWISNKIKNVWNNGIKPVIDTLVKVIKSDPKKAFEAARDGIGKAWDGIKELAKKPVKFVVETVINGLIGTINKIPGVNIPKVSLPKGFRTGGYTGDVGVNTAAGIVHGREFVTRAESTAKIRKNHPGVLEHMNRYGEIPGYRSGGWVDPLPAGSFTVSQPFGRAQSFGGYHNGIDLAAPLGTKILAPRKGVASTFVDSLGGNMVSVMHDNGYVTRYAHLGSYGVQSGQSVSRGQMLGRIGMTGLTTGPHLHYMMSRPPGGWGDVVDPAGFMGGRNSESAGMFDILAGLSSWAMDKFKASFPGSDMWVDAAGGLMKQAVESVVEWGKGKLGADVGGVSRYAPKLYDNGGWLDPGLSLVENRTRKPEPILTSGQWDSMSRLAEQRGISGPVKLVVADREFDAFLEEIADDRVRVNLGGFSRASLRRDGGMERF